jgi:sarcosine oxidase subunit alpha
MDDSPRRYWYRGRPRESRGTTGLASDVVQADGPIVSRSIRYHRPRGVFCGEGFCSQCLVRVNGRPNVRSCRYIPADGDRVETENAWPSVRTDVLGALDFLFPGGIDTVRGFRRPAFARPLYHKVVRRLSGYGQLATAAPTPAPPPLRHATDVLVVGAGPAGRAAASKLAREGRQVALIDRRAVTAPPPGVRVIDRATAAFLPPPVEEAERPFRLAGIGDRGQGIDLSASTVVLAPGSYDASLWCAGSDRPGVITAEGALSLRTARGDVPFHRALLVGGGARAAEMLDRFGPRIEGIVAPGPIAPEVVRRANELDVPMFPRTLLLGVEGRRRVRSVRCRARGSASAPFSLPGDAVILAHRRIPHVPLFFQVGARMEWRSEGGAYFPALQPDLATSVPGLWACGEAAGFPDPIGSEASGGAVAERILGRSASLAALPPRVGTGSPGEMEGYYRELFAGPRPGGKWIACACEDVTLEELRTAHDRGFSGIEVVKRYTGLGTGLCQGRYCLPEALAYLSILEGRPIPEVGFITQRPPSEPTPLSAWASLSEESR